MDCSAKSDEPESGSLAIVGAAPALHQVLLLQGAHEIRNQLAIILLELGRISGASARQMEGEVRTLSLTVERMALLARMSSRIDTSMADVDLSAVVAETVARCAGFPRLRSVRFEHVDRGGGVMRAHRISVSEAISCLVENAYRHAPLGEHIIVTSGAGPIVTVDDDGPGLPARTLAELVEPFATGRTPGAGAGLGLTIANQVACLHGGELRAMRSPQGGTRMQLVFGLANGP